jgi:hypothetical protein
MENHKVGLGVEFIEPVVDRFDPLGIDGAEISRRQPAQPFGQLVEPVPLQIRQGIGLVDRVRDQHWRDIVDLANIVDALLGGEPIEHGQAWAQMFKTFADPVPLQCLDVLRRHSDQLVVVGVGNCARIINQAIAEFTHASLPSRPGDIVQSANHPPPDQTGSLRDTEPT